MEISYGYEPSRAYAKAIGDAKTSNELHDALTPYSLIAGDALDTFASTDFNFKEFRDGLLKERKKEFAGVEWIMKYGAIIMPTLMRRVEIIANRNNVQWGMAYIRLREVGMIVEKDGRAIWKE